jgi:hypothetical protein
MRGNQETLLFIPNVKGRLFPGGGAADGLAIQSKGRGNAALKENIKTETRRMAHQEKKQPESIKELRQQQHTFVENEESIDEQGDPIEREGNDLSGFWRTRRQS